MRGIETRRHDTPKLFVYFQEELMKIMSAYNNIHEITKCLPILENVHKKYINLICTKKISYTDLIFIKRMSKASNEYADRNTIENCVLKQLINNGKSLNAGEEIKYIITNFYNENFLERAIPIELIDENDIKYDTKRYLELLKETYDSVTKFFYSQIPKFD